MVCPNCKFEISEDNTSKIMTTLMVIVLLIFISLFTFSNETNGLYEEGTGYICKSSWWGLKKEYTTVYSVDGRWMTYDQNGPRILYNDDNYPELNDYEPF